MEAYVALLEQRSVLEQGARGHRCTIVGIEEGNVEQATSLVTTGYTTWSTSGVAVVLVECSDVHEASLVATPGHGAGKRVSKGG